MLSYRATFHVKKSYKSPLIITVISINTVTVICKMIIMYTIFNIF